jgi:hypothetical protein
MREHDLSAKYLVLPPNINIKDIVIGVNTKAVNRKSILASRTRAADRPIRPSG